MMAKTPNFTGWRVVILAEEDANTRSCAASWPCSASPRRCNGCRLPTTSCPIS